MRSLLSRYIYLLAMLVASSRILAAETRILDLSQPSIGFENPISVSNGMLTVEIINKVPSASYRVNWHIETRLLPPFSVSSFPDEPRLAAECQDVKEPFEKLNAATTEQEVAAAVPDLKEALQDCSVDRPLIRAATKTLAATTERVEVALDYESELRIEVVRFGMQAEVKEWEAAYRTPDSGQWILSYGFTFVPNNDDLFFSKQDASDSGKYHITRKSDNRDWDFAPSIFYSWMPERFRTSYGFFSLGGGLGFDLSNPIVFFGPAFTIRHNLTIAGGVVVHKEKRLNGKYSPGDEVSENLSEDQLKEETYKPTWFAGLTFRFDSAPSSHKKPPSAPATKDASGDKTGKGKEASKEQGNDGAK
jgi:hypothetical protein